MASLAPTPSPTPNPFVGVPTDQVQTALNNMADFGMVSPSNMLALQNAANKDIEERRRASSIDAMTFRDAVVDAHDALVGVMGDLTQGSDRRSLKEIFVYENRLRGLGFLLIALSLVGLFADYIVSS